MKPFAFKAVSCLSSVFFRIPSISAIFRIEIFGFPLKMSQIRRCSSGKDNNGLSPPIVPPIVPCLIRTPTFHDQANRIADAPALAVRKGDDGLKPPPQLFVRRAFQFKFRRLALSDVINQHFTHLAFGRELYQTAAKCGQPPNLIHTPSFYNSTRQTPSLPRSRLSRSPRQFPSFYNSTTLHG